MHESGYFERVDIPQQPEEVTLELARDEKETAGAGGAAIRPDVLHESSGRRKSFPRRRVRDRLVAVRLTTDEYEDLRSFCDANNVGLSTWARERLQEHLSMNRNGRGGKKASGGDLAQIARNLSVLQETLHNLQILLRSALMPQQT